MNPLAPYMVWIKVGGLALVLAFVFGAGCKAQANRDAKKLAAKDLAIENAATALRAAGSAIREINEEAERRIKAAAAQESAAKEAASVLLQANAAIERQRKADEAKWAKAKQNPGCAALLQADLAKTCGVKPR